MTEPIDTIGTKLKPHVQHRDAIHIAILPCTLGTICKPGDRVSIMPGSGNIVVKKKNKSKAIGIVDPFLPDEQLKVSTKVWVFLFPNTVTGLRHHWAHPEVDSDEIQKEAAELWLREFAHRWSFDYDSLINGAINGNWVTSHNDLHGSEELGDDHDEFWAAMELLTGRTFSVTHRADIAWSCSC